MKDYKILLKYYKDLLDEDVINKYDTDLTKMNIAQYKYDKSDIIMNSAGDIFNNVSLVINSNLVQAIITSVITSGFYDVLKSYIVWIWNNTKEKYLTKTTCSGAEKEKVTFGLNIDIDQYTKVNVSLEGDVSDELKSKCVDKVFEFIKDVPLKNKPSIDDIARYNWDNEEWYLVDIMEEIKRLKEEKNKEKCDTN